MIGKSLYEGKVAEPSGRTERSRTPSRPRFEIRGRNGNPHALPFFEQEMWREGALQIPDGRIPYLDGRATRQAGATRFSANTPEGLVPISSTEVPKNFPKTPPTENTDHKLRAGFQQPGKIRSDGRDVCGAIQAGKVRKRAVERSLLIENAYALRRQDTKLNR